MEPVSRTMSLLTHTAYIGLGSNLRNREENMVLATEDLGSLIVKMSFLYETEPVGPHQPWFLNAVLQIETDWSAHQLLKECQRVEVMLHRERVVPKGPRTIDLDILFYDDLIVNEPDLVIPHAAIAERRFVLEPLCEIAPNFVHPVLKKSIAELLSLCPDRSVVRKW